MVYDIPTDRAARRSSAGGPEGRCHIHPGDVRVELVPGALVRHPAEPDWGIGQVQSVDGHRVTVNFEHVGKQLINAEVISLEVVDGEDL